jgi:hypothetical protein
MKRPAHDGTEQDAFSRYWRSVNFWQRGELRKIKRRANRRERRNARAEIQEEIRDERS